MKRIITLVALFMSVLGFAQNVSDYKYIVVPAKYSFLKEANKYNLNALTKMVFEKQGYEVYYDNDILPLDLAENRCRALFADMSEKSSMFVTKLKLELKDCKNQTVYVSAEGVSREKEYAKAYVQAFREVGKSIEALRSKPVQAVVEIKADTKNEIVAETVSSQLFAQPIGNGFQLVDSSPKVVMKLFKTSLSNFYIAQKENIQGVVFNKNNQWFFEYYLNEKLVSEKLEIKF
jgi:hypothetical protein